MGGNQSRPALGIRSFIEAPSDGSNVNTYDYVIVGGGSAGCVLASRLSENRQVTVLLLEAGRNFQGDRPSSIPFTFSHVFGTDRDWNWSTTLMEQSPQRHLNGRETRWHSGKILGGTSAINASVYDRCPPEDFDEWVSLGATGWSYPELLPYFMKAENVHGSSKAGSVDTAEHGLHGPLQTAFPSETAPVNDFMIEACQAIGLPYINDINARRGSLGVTRLMGTLDAKGRKSSTASAYLSDDVLKRPNLRVVAEVMVEKILFSSPNGSDETPRAIGVKVSGGPNTTGVSISATREVILCGGTVGTPQILMLSGLGPGDDLRKLDIPVVKNLPQVGRNVIDHVSSGPLPFRVKPGLTYDYLNHVVSGPMSTVKWLIFGTGPLASLSFSSTAFVRSTDDKLPYRGPGGAAAPVNDRTSNPGVPDLQLLWYPAGVTDSTYRTLTGYNAVSLSAVALKPESRGRITLTSNSVWDQPLIDPNYLSTESDMNVLVRGVRLLLRIAHTEPMASKLVPQGRLWAEIADPDNISDEEIRHAICDTASSAWNPVSSARIGLSSEDSVVDSQLRVHGISGLRIVDASVFPTQVSGQSCAVVVAMAEKAADMIQQR